MRISHHVLDLLFAASAVSLPFADPAPQPAKVDPIRLPVGPTNPPVPVPVPSAVSALASDQIYVIDSDVAVTVLASPSGIVSISEDSGPVKLRGRFVDGNGKSETRTYKGKSVFTVEAVATGRVELLIIPAGGSTADVIRRTIDVTAGQAPQPPPTPGPEPSPEPDRKPVALWGFVVIEETADAVASRGALLSDPSLASFLKAKGYHWRIVDKDVVGPDGKPPADVTAALQAASGKGYPQLFVVDAKGNLLGQQPLPNAAGVVAALKKYGG